MPDTPTQPDPETADLLEYRVGHYLGAVAQHLVRDGFAITRALAEGPFLEGVSKGEPHLIDAEGHLAFGTVFATQFTPLHDVALRWNAQSSWHIVRQTDGPEECRWLGQGLVPAPDRVAAFTASAQLEFASAGSDEQPFYRHDGDPYTDLLERLAAYTPDEPGPGEERIEGHAVFAGERRRIYERRVLDALLTTGPDPVLQIPLRRSEVRALALFLEWFEPVFSTGSSAVAAMLQLDLTRRVPGDAASADRERAVLDAARYRLERLESGQRW